MKNFAPLALVFTLAGAPAFAHAFLKHASPSVGSIMKVPPTTLLLSFTEDLEVPFCTVTVTSASGVPVQTSRPQAVPGHKDEISVSLHITAPGTYTVNWHALSVDTHKTEGSFNFFVRQ